MFAETKINEMRLSLKYSSFSYIDYDRNAFINSKTEHTIYKFLLPRGFDPRFFGGVRL